MGRFFVGLDGRPDQAATPLTEIFHLEDQLAAASAAASDNESDRIMTHAVTRHPVHPRRPGHRAALVGVRQLRHPLPRVHDGGHAPRPVREDRGCRAGQRVHELAPSVALHIPWDKVDDYADLRRHAEDLGVSLGTINSNTFQDEDYKFGALTHHDDRIRHKAIDHHLECIDIMDATGSRDLKIWLAEGSNYPGQADIRAPPGPPAGLAAEDLRPPVGRAAARARVQVLRAVVLPHRCSGLGHVLRAGRRRSATGRWSASTPATTRRARTSSSSSCSCCASESSARSTSTRASTPTTTSSWAPPTRSSCSASSSRSSAAAASTTPMWRSCSTSATTSRTRSPARSARC